MDPSTVYAIAILNPEDNSGVSGVVKLVKQGKETRIQAEIKGLTDGEHGFHIHEFGNLLQGCTTAGPHYNPLKKDHGGPMDSERHVGDLGNIISKGGVAKLDIIDKVVQLDGQYPVVGRAFVVHAKPDDLGKPNDPESKKTGNAGARLACGVIGLSGPLEFL